MIFNFFNQLSNASGLPPIVTMGALVIIVSLTLFGSLILIKVRSIIKVLNNLNNRLDTIGQRSGWPSGETENIQPYNSKLGSPINNEVAADSRRAIETNDTEKIAQNNGSEGHRINTEFSTKIHELLKKFGRPTPYHDLTKQLSREYPDYNYDFFLKEAENLQKEGKVEVQLIAGKLYFQIKNT